MRAIAMATPRQRRAEANRSAVAERPRQESGRFGPKRAESAAMLPPTRRSDHAQSRDDQERGNFAADQAP